MSTRIAQNPSTGRPRTAMRYAALPALVLAAILPACKKHSHDDPPPPLPAASGPGGTVSGTIRYTNRIYTSAAGFTGATEWVPVRQAEVEVVYAPTGTVVGNGVTDDTGAYAIPLPDYGTIRIFTRVYARRLDSTSGVASPIEAVVRSTGGALYTAAAPSVSVDTGLPQTIDVDIPLASSSPFNIFDSAVITQQFLNILDGTIVDPPLITLYWSSGSGDGTYYDPDTSSIHLLGLSTDADDFDDDIILHELGHYVLTHYSRDDSPGGSHMLSGHYDIRLTWSEGWAHYWSAAARKWAGYPAYVWQVDTFGTTSFGTWRIDTPSYDAQAIGADNEVAVAAVLWDLSAGAADGGSLDLGDDEIWDVVSTRFAARYTPLTGERFATLEDFHDEWYAVPYPSIASVLSGRTIRYVLDAEDASTPNDTGADATPLPALPATLTERTFFKSGSDPVGDEDWFSFSATADTTYRIETAGLGDGADTYIRVYSDAAGTDEVAANDDQAAGNLSSLVTFTPSADSTFYIRVAPYPCAGTYPDADQVTTYGSYTLSVTAP